MDAHVVHTGQKIGDAVVTLTEFLFLHSHLLTPGPVRVALGP
jgi:hypothetical protein